MEVRFNNLAVINLDSCLTILHSLKLLYIALLQNVITIINRRALNDGQPTYLASKLISY